MVQEVSLRPTKMSRDGALLMSALHNLVPEAIQISIKMNRSGGWTCYRQYVPMCFIPIPAQGFHGLFIETNVVEIGRWKRESFAKFITNMGYKYLPPEPWHKSLAHIEEYLKDAPLRWDFEQEVYEDKIKLGYLSPDGEVTRPKNNGRGKPVLLESACRLGTRKRRNKRAPAS